MANIPQRDPETAGGTPSSIQGSTPFPCDDDHLSNSRPASPATTPIPGPRNLVSDEVWGWNNTAGGVNAPLTPEIPVTKGE